MVLYIGKFIVVMTRYTGTFLKRKKTPNETEYYETKHRVKNFQFFNNRI